MNHTAAPWLPSSREWSQACTSPDDIAAQLARRRLGYGRGARMKFEQDQVTVLAGVRHGQTLGGPIAIEIGNTEWPKWETVMAADPVDPAELDVARNAPLTRPRPGHADYAGMVKVRLRRRPPGTGAGQCPRDRSPRRGWNGGPALLRQALGWEVVSHVVSIGARSPMSGRRRRLPTSTGSMRARSAPSTRLRRSP